MLPLSLIQSLSPIAAKLYLVLQSSTDPANPGNITLTVNQLAQRAALSRRSCLYALRQLQNHHLIQRLPADRNTLMVQPIAPSTLQPAAPVQPAAPSTVQPTALSPAKTPISSPKTHMVQPAAPLLNPMDLALLSTHMHSLSPATQAALIAQAQATLARLNTKEAHP